MHILNKFARLPLYLRKSDKQCKKLRKKSWGAFGELAKVRVVDKRFIKI